MKRAAVIFLTIFLLIAAVHRCPAPIQEIAESPTPAPQESISPRKARPPAKRPSEQESSAPAKHRQAASATQAKAQKEENQSLCGGTWVGILSVGFMGNANETLTINSAGTMVFEKNQFGSATHDSSWDGSTVRFQAGALNEIAFTLTPNADGHTAVVTANSLFISNPGAAFRKVATSEAAAATATSTTSAAAKKSEIPTAKPVSEKPGFVYNPFDPTGRLLDVRGKSSGTKIKDPVSGKLFIVP